MDRSIDSPRTRSVVGVRGPGVSVFGLPEQKALMKYLITDKGYTQLINQYTTDCRTQIDHVPQIMCTISG